MTEYEIKLQPIITIENFQFFLKDINSDFKKSFEYEKVIFNFKECQTIVPVAIVYLRIWRDLLNEKKIETFYRAHENSTLKFLKKAKLFDPDSEEDLNCGHNDGTFMYSLHRCMSTSECTCARNDIIKNIVGKDDISTGTYAAIDYMMGELWDKAGAHGYKCYYEEEYPKPVYICAFEHNNNIEICIGDLGQGIYNSLANNNEEFKNKGKKQIILESIKDGVSGHPKGSPGFGLYCSREFLKSTDGSLNIWSSDCYLKLIKQEKKVYTSCFNKGTIVTFVIPKSALIPFDEVLTKKSCYKRTAQDYIEDMMEGIFNE